MKMWSGSETKLCICNLDSQFGIKIFALNPWILISFFIFSLINFSWMITALKVMDLGKWSLKLKQTKVLCNHQLYYKHQIIYTLRVKKIDRNNVFNHKYRPMHQNHYVLLSEAYQQVTIANYFLVFFCFDDTSLYVYSNFIYIYYRW